MFYLYCSVNGWLTGDRYESWFGGENVLASKRETFADEAAAYWYLHNANGQRIETRSLVAV